MLNTRTLLIACGCGALAWSASVAHGKGNIEAETLATARQVDGVSLPAGAAITAAAQRSRARGGVRRVPRTGDVRSVRSLSTSTDGVVMPSSSRTILVIGCTLTVAS